MTVFQELPDDDVRRPAPQVGERVVGVGSGGQRTLLTTDSTTLFNAAATGQPA